MNMKKQSLQLNPEEIRLQSYGKSKTEKVLQKWASEEGEIAEEDIRKAASNYARLEINNKILKWIIIVIIVFLFVLLGFMIASVVIGVNITKDITVKNGALVVNSGNNSVIKTSNMEYITRITLNTPAEIIDSLKTITIKVYEGLYVGIIQFDVVSYVFIPGQSLIFYGHTHMASIMPDGSVNYECLIPFDGSIPPVGPSSSNYVSGASGSYSLSSAFIPIYTCDDINNIQPTGNYLLQQSLFCNNLKLPLLSGQIFTGTLDGNGLNITINGNYQTNVGLFETLGGTILNLELAGSMTGLGKCGVFAVNALGGSYLSKCSSYVDLTCEDNNLDFVAGGFFATLQPNENELVIFTQCVSQATITYNDISALVGGFYGIGNSDTSLASFTYCAFDAIFSSIGKSTDYGFFNNGNSDCQKTNNYCLVNVGATNEELPCCYPIERCPNNPDYLNCDSLFCYACRDTSFRTNTMKRAPKLRYSPGTKVRPRYNTC